VLRVKVPDNVEATVSLPAGTVPYLASGAGAPRYQGTSSGRDIYLVGSGVQLLAGQHRSGGGSRR
jgi:hypothetical protein